MQLADILNIQFPSLDFAMGHQHWSIAFNYNVEASHHEQWNSIHFLSMQLQEKNTMLQKYVHMITT